VQTLQEVSLVFRITRERVRVIENEAKEQLTELVEASHIGGH